MYILTKFLIGCGQIRHFGETSYSTNRTPKWQHIKYLQGMKAVHCLIIRHITHSSPLGTSPSSSSVVFSVGAWLLLRLSCRCYDCWWRLHSFHLIQFLCKIHSIKPINRLAWWNLKLIVLDNHILNVHVESVLQISQEEFNNKNKFRVLERQVFAPSHRIDKDA